MTVEAVKDAIAHLSNEERKQIVDWLEDLEEEAWDRQIEQDSAPGGRLAHLLEEVKADVAAGRTKPMEQFLAEASRLRELDADRSLQSQLPRNGSV